jgi:hypothetical protein
VLHRSNTIGIAQPGSCEDRIEMRRTSPTLVVQNHRRMSSARRVLVVAALAVACSESDAPTTYGDLVFEVRAADADPTATFEGTTTLVATVGYGACLDEHYREHDEDAFTSELGKEAVAEWSASLCDPEEADDPDLVIPCEVVALEQRVGGGLTGLAATYAVTGDIAGNQLRVGPFPDEDSTSCDGGALPGLHVGTDALVGRDAEDVVIWTANAIEGTVAVVDQRAPVVVYATRVAPP